MYRTDCGTAYPVLLNRLSKVNTSCLGTATGRLYVTLMSQVVVYAPAVRAETFSLSRLSPSLLCGFNSQQGPPLSGPSGHNFSTKQK
jgi:hypothetical protein